MDDTRQVKPRRDIKTVRVVRGITQQAFAKRINRSQSWVSGVERGYITPSREDQSRIAEILGVDLSGPPARGRRGARR